jgi:surface polysaccharide O-acyltransferase-like enzyme
LASLGLGSVGSAYFANLTKFKPLFVLITGILLYKGYSVMEKKNASKGTKIFFWISAAVSILALYYPTILRFISAS